MTDDGTLWQGRALTLDEVHSGTLTGIVDAAGNLVEVHPMPLTSYLQNRTLARPLREAPSGECK